jgi:hypothetical protein
MWSRLGRRRKNHFHSRHSLISLSPFADDLNVEPISIIGRQRSAGGSSPNLNSHPTSPTEESDIFSSGDDLPPPVQGKKKVIVAQRPNNLLHKVRVSIMEESL